MLLILIHLDASMLSRLKARDEKVFSQLYESSSAILFGLALKISKKQEIAEDILHDSFVKIWNNLHLFDEEKASILTWMTQIVRNTALDSLRNKHNRNIQWDDTNVYLKDEPFEVPKVNHIGMDELIKKLNPEFQRIIEVIYFMGLTHEEAAEKLNIPLGTLKTRARMAIHELRKIFGVN